MLKSIKRLLLLTSLLLIAIGLSGCGVRYVNRQGSQRSRHLGNSFQAKENCCRLG